MQIFGVASNIIGKMNRAGLQTRNLRYITSEMSGFHQGGYSCISSAQTKLREMLQRLESSFTKEIKSFRIGGKDTEFVVYKGSKTAGSNPGYWVKSKETGELSLIKFGKTSAIEAGQQIHSEHLANELYELGGIGATKQSIVNEMESAYKIKRTGVSSRFVPIDGYPSLADAPTVREGFGMDCWLANWDALKRGNVVMSEGRVVRLDNGGALCYRAQGARKTAAEFGENVNELTSFFEPYSLSLPYLKDMTREELIKSLDRVCKIPESKINKVIDEAAIYTKSPYGQKYNYLTGKYGSVGEDVIFTRGVENPEFLRETLIARKKYIESFRDMCKMYPQQNGESIADYVRRIDAGIPKTKYKIPFDKITMSTRVREGKLTMGQCLTPSQKRLYEDSLNAYRSSKVQIIEHMQADDVLTADVMLHAGNYRNIGSYLDKGITWSEFRGNTGTGMETLTPLCADFWDVTERATIKEYFAKPAWKFNEGELNFMTCQEKPRGGIIFVIDKKAVNPTLMKNSFLVKDRDKGSILFKDGNMDPHCDYITHRAVPTGVPANAIDRIIIDPRNKGQQEVAKIVEEIEKRGLDIKVYDINGKKLYGGKKKFTSPFGSEPISGFRKYPSFSRPEATMDAIIKATHFENMGGNPIPLKMSREEFIKELNSILKTVPQNERTAFLSKFNLTINDAHYIDGFPSIKGILPSNENERKMLNLVQRFYTNEAGAEVNSSLKPVIDSMLKEYPEFAMVIGKSQHATHNYTVDIHTLSVMQKAMSNPAYEILSDESKQVLKLATMMHDFGKMGGLHSPGHAAISRKYAEEILSNHNVSEPIKTRVLNLIENHHWFKEYNKGLMNAEDVAKMFKNPEDRIIAIIMTKGDLESINSTFHLRTLIPGQTLTPEQYEESFARIIRNLQRDMAAYDFQV